MKFKLSFDDKEYTCVVNVKDTTAPKAVLQTVKIYQNQKD